MWKIIYVIIGHTYTHHYFLIVYKLVSCNLISPLFSVCLRCFIQIFLNADAIKPHSNFCTNQKFGDNVFSWWIVNSFRLIYQFTLLNRRFNDGSIYHYRAVPDELGYFWQRPCGNWQMIRVAVTFSLTLCWNVVYLCSSVLYPIVECLVTKFTYELQQ